MARRTADHAVRPRRERPPVLEVAGRAETWLDCHGSFHRKCGGKSGADEERRQQHGRSQPPPRALAVTRRRARQVFCRMLHRCARAGSRPGFAGGPALDPNRKGPTSCHPCGSAATRTGSPWGARGGPALLGIPADPAQGHASAPRAPREQERKPLTESVQWALTCQDARLRKGPRGHELLFSAPR
jgi:hypothetical protein